MNWNFHISFITTIIVVLILILIYRNREKDEGNLGFKLIGYYLLGTFNLNFNIVIPIGIIIWLLFFHPTTNQKAKRYSAIFGLLMMIVGHLVPLP
jgi:hypothetical protein